MFVTRTENEEFPADDVPELSESSDDDEVELKGQSQCLNGSQSQWNREHANSTRSRQDKESEEEEELPHNSDDNFGSGNRSYLQIMDMREQIRKVDREMKQR